MENYQIIRNALAKQPEAIRSQQKLRSLLCDCFPGNKLIVNTFLMAYEEGLFSRLQEVDVVDEFSFQKYIGLLTSNYGVSDETAHDTLLLVSNVLGKTVFEPERTSGNAAVPNSGAPSPAIPSGGFSPASDFSYTSDGFEITIEKYVGKGGKVVIPSMINGLPVTRIADEAFGNSEKVSNRVTGIELPSELEYIGESAFQNLKMLSGIIVLPRTLVEIGWEAFSSTAVTGLVVRSSCDMRGRSFSDIKTMKFVYVVKGCAAEIGYASFRGNEDITDVILPEDVRCIDDDAFRGCKKMTLYTPDGSHAVAYARKKKNSLQTDSSQYEKMNSYYESIYT